MENLKCLMLPASYEIDENFDDEKYIKMRLRVCHDGINRKNTQFSIDSIDRAKDSLKNIPVLGHVIFDEDGEPQFGGHDMKIVSTKEGGRLFYEETPIGVIPESNNYEIVNYGDFRFVYVDAYIWRGYANYAEDIINRDSEIQLSMEILIDQYEHNDEYDVVDIMEYRYRGITYLGNDRTTGMEDAGAWVYSDDDHAKERFYTIINEVNQLLYSVDDKSKKEVGNTLDEKMALLQKYEMNAEDLGFDLADYTVDEVETKIKDLKYELTMCATMEEVHRILSQQEKYVDEWGWEESRYWFVDIQGDEVIVYDTKDLWRIYGLMIKRDGDNISLDFENPVRKKVVYADYEGGEEGIVGAFDGYVKELFDRVKADYDSVVGTVDELTQKAAEATSKYEEIKPKYEAYVAAEETARAEAENARFEALFARFDKDLADNDEYSAIKNDHAKMSVEDVHKECLFILDKVNSGKSTPVVPKDSSVPVKFSVTADKLEDLPYGGFVEKYSKKK